ncbi:Nas6p KNAG_0A01570 [Huiozyma naganishii CBS 8797]|uniref:Uncharacterized protein n=1 Tax=Huiozyma naganishii (strain ATCC MYA-139 / BCRC 22969 / CBS 8797 / KCTC 17520 / NBRC 10181 / NCYC 3082 / Yp74L-3) TaxID=1071383 RepID=J7S380_HUIN7|nr:hypothetical protein KNAG_0A01570 [Kazachstania naganishii CBS 8797]CCK67846.1 hypothetical protein KNAG_0A01570 [Kazachstania naganishii CBS 8797]
MPQTFALHQACMNGNLSEAAAIISDAETPASLVLDRDQSERTPLHWAVSFNHQDIVALLLAHMQGVDLDTLLDDSNWTPFHIACAVGSLTLVKKLYERDTKPDLNLQTGQGTTALHLAVAKGHYEVVRFLVENGASTRIKDKNQQIPLHRAASVGSMKLVEFLCTAGKSPINWTDRSGWTPLFHALAEGHGDVAVTLVVKYEADQDIEDGRNQKAVDVALNDEVRNYFTNNI